MKHPAVIFPASLILIIVMVAIAVYVPNSLPAGSDFSALYNTDLALVNGVPIYELEAVEALAVKASGIPPENFFLARFPYPPWYALSTFYLGMLPAQAAAMLWFEINLLMLFLSIWFITDGWDGRLRLTAFPLALFFLPVLGALSVGQYDFPVLLGTSMLIYSLKRENILLTILGAILLTFKPHVGALVLLSALIWLIARRDNPALSSIEGFGRGVMRTLLIAGAALFLLGFLADPDWIVSYPKMLLTYQDEGNVASCSECASLPVFLARWFFDGSLSNAVLIAAALLIVLAGIFFMKRKALLKSHELLLTSSLLITLLVSPYLYNYDFLLLLVPFAIHAGTGSIAHRLVVIGCYLVPTLTILWLGREGNISLLIAAILLAVLLHQRAGKLEIDVPAPAS
jgi:hypothetical protein